VPTLTHADAHAFAACIERGGVAVFPADTVYGLACDPEDEAAVRRLYELKGRPPDKPAAVMWFDRDRALEALPELGPRTRAACERLLPGPVTLLVPNERGRFPLAGGFAGEGAGSGGPASTDPAGEPAGGLSALGVRVPKLTGQLAPLQALSLVVLQSSANHAGGPDARQVGQVPQAIRTNADLVLDAGPLPGTPSTVIDLKRYEREGAYEIVRQGALSPAEIARALGIVGDP
jgi:L-threonylcarbamoyladenylate synthase